MEQILFHGSHRSGLRNLSNEWCVSENVPTVFATGDYIYALVRAGIFGRKKLIREEYYGFNKPYELAELSEGAFNKTFNTSGSIYIVDTRWFMKTTNNGGEWISRAPIIPVISEIEIPNVWDEMKRYPDRFQLVSYGTDEWVKYWDTVRGGLDGYIERVAERRSQLFVR